MGVGDTHIHEDEPLREQRGPLSEFPRHWQYISRRDSVEEDGIRRH